MDTRQVLLVDACTAEPTGGTPVAVCPDGAGLADDQLRALARELAADVAALDGDDLRVVGPTGDRTHHPHATVAALAAAHERGEREAGNHTVVTVGGDVDAEVTVEGGVWLERQTPTADEADVDHATVADALGIDVAALRDVGADLPPTVVSAGVDALAVPVNFLEHVSGASPDASALADLLSTVEADAVFAFTFDTLAEDASAHARAFTTAPDVWTRRLGTEVPVTPAVAGGVVSRLYDDDIVEDATTAVEQGHFCERPGKIYVEAGSGLRIGGRAVTTTDATVTLPEAEDDDIIEV